MPTLVQPGDELPAKTLEPLNRRARVRNGAHRPRAQVIVVPHETVCDDCVSYLRSFDPIAQDLSDEKADVLVVVSRKWEEAAESLSVPLLLDDGRMARWIAEPESPTVVVADRFGQVFLRVEAGADHEFPDHTKVLRSLLDIGIRCPECGVPDVPSPDTLPEEGSRSGGMSLIGG